MIEILKDTIEVTKMVLGAIVILVFGTAILSSIFFAVVGFIEEICEATIKEVRSGKNDGT